MALVLGHVTLLHLYRRRRSIWLRNIHQTLVGRRPALLPANNTPLISPHTNDPLKTVIASSENIHVL